MTNSFKEFMQVFIAENYTDLIVESVESVIKNISKEKLYAPLGVDFIQETYDNYISSGAIPTKLKRGGVAKNIPEKDRAEVFQYLFKSVDRDVKNALTRVTEVMDNNKLRKTLNRNYGKTVKPVVEDSSEIGDIMKSYLLLKNKPKYNLPKILEPKVDYRELSEKVNTALEEYVKEFTAPTENEEGGESDLVLPEGWEFIDRKGDMEFFLWFNPVEVCAMGPKDRGQFLAKSENVATGEMDKHIWCVNNISYARTYGEGEGDENFKYPFYIVRKANKPYVAMCGKKLEAKDDKDMPISQEIADEIWEAFLSKPAKDQIITKHGYKPSDSAENWLDEILKDHI